LRYSLLVGSINHYGQNYIQCLTRLTIDVVAKYGISEQNKTDAETVAAWMQEEAWDIADLESLGTDDRPPLRPIE
jgi:hypothetical protein